MGLYWLLPLLLAMYGDTIGLWSMAASKDAPPNLELALLPMEDCLGPALCPALPANCRIRCYQWADEMWAPFHPLVRFLMEFQCQWLTPMPERMESLRDCGEGAPGIVPNDEDLFVCTAGGIPVSTATVSWLPDSDYDGHALQIAALCSVTNSGGGTLMLNRLRRVAMAHGYRHLLITSKHRSRGFYLRYGFRPMFQPGAGNENELVLDLFDAATPPPPPVSRGAPQPKRCKMRMGIFTCKRAYDRRIHQWVRNGLRPVPMVLRPPQFWMPVWMMADDGDEEDNNRQPTVASEIAIQP